MTKPRRRHRRLTEAPGDPVAFELIQQDLADLPAAARCKLAGLYPADMQAEAWARVREETDCRRYFEGDLDFEAIAPPKPRRRRLRAMPGGNGARLPERDILAEIETREYVEALTGEEVPRHGTIPCPLPGHDERTPSFKVYPGTRGFFCFGCQRGGDIYTLAAELSGIPNRGPAFIELRKWIADRIHTSTLKAAA